MAKDPLLPDPPRDGDSWESLAGNLFGIDLNAPDDDLLSPEEFDALQVEPPQPVAAETAAKPAAESAESSPPPADPVRESRESAKRHADEDDAFWDPLKSWQWDEEDLHAETIAVEEPQDDEPADQPVDELIKGPGSDARRAAESFETVSDYRTEYDTSGDGWEFGAGLLEEVPLPPPKTAERPPAPRAVESPPERPPRREEPRKPAAVDEPPTRTAKPAPPAAPAARKAVAEGDDFGAGLLEPVSTAEPVGEEPPRERRSRRGGRRRRASSDEREPDAKIKAKDVRAEPTESPRVAKEAAAETSRPEPEADEESRGRKKSDKKSPYRNIPTWETAISYLLNRTAKATAETSGVAERKREREVESEAGSSSERRPRGRRRRRRPKS